MTWMLRCGLTPVGLKSKGCNAGHLISSRQHSTVCIAELAHRQVHLHRTLLPLFASTSPVAVIINRSDVNSTLTITVISSIIIWYQSPFQ